MSDEHFIVWMRTAALPTFRNLYGRIEHDLMAPATITFDVTASETFSIKEFCMIKENCTRRTDHALDHLHPYLPESDVAQDLCSTYPTQEPCASSFRFLVGMSYSIQIRTLSALKYLDHEVGRGDVSIVWKSASGLDLWW